MPSQPKLDNMYMAVADRVAEMSHGLRSKVGAVLAKDDNIISYGWNGTPAGDDNLCEIENADGTLTSKNSVLHAESNVLTKLAANGGIGAKGATLYVTLSPCFDCAKLIKQSKISRVVYRQQYRLLDGIEFLRERGVEVTQLCPEITHNTENI